MKIAPSILNSNFINLGEVLDSLKTSDFIHIDIMDGHFVPNISFGPDITYQISQKTNVGLDVHLMIANPLEYIDRFAKSKPEYLTVHVESNDYLEALNLIKKHQIKTGISLKPNTSVDEIKHVLSEVDLVLVMSVEPGFGGQQFMANSLEKIKELKRLRMMNNYHYLIEVDGGINNETARLVKDAGGDIIVVGSYLMKQKNIPETIEKLR